VMVGLDGSGKTSILRQLIDQKPGILRPTISTIGFNLETVRTRTGIFTLWGFGGNERIRPMWRCYYWNGHAFIFVVSLAPSDRGRINVAREELHTMVQELDRASLVNPPLLVLANKSDLNTAQVTAESGIQGQVEVPPWTKEGLWEALEMDRMEHKIKTIIFCSALTNDGLQEGLAWIASKVTPEMIAQRHHNH